MMRTSYLFRFPHSRCCCSTANYNNNAFKFTPVLLQNKSTADKSRNFETSANKTARMMQPLKDNTVVNLKRPATKLQDEQKRKEQQTELVTEAEVPLPAKWKPTHSPLLTSQEKILATLNHKPTYVEGPVKSESSEDGGKTGEINFKPGTKIPSNLTIKKNDKTGEEVELAEAARSDLGVSKITVTKSHVVQQSGTPDTRGHVVGVTGSGVPILHRDPDVAYPESYVTGDDLTDTFYELSEGFDPRLHYVEIARDNMTLVSAWMTGMFAYYYSWPVILGWPLTLTAFAAIQRYWAWSGTKLKTRNMLPDSVLEGKICLITGGSSGVGLETAVSLATRGADVIVSTRRPVDEFWKEWDKALLRSSRRSSSKEDREKISRRISVCQVDLSEFHSIRNFHNFVQDRLKLHAKAHGRDRLLTTVSGSSNVDNTASSSSENINNKNNQQKQKQKEESTLAEPEKKNSKKKLDSKKEKTSSLSAPPPLDLLINNAGMMTSETKFNSLNTELHIATNVLGPMFLTELLLPNIRRAASLSNSSSSSDKNNNNTNKKLPSLGRIVNVTSMAHVAVLEPALVQRELLPKNIKNNKEVNMALRYSVSKLCNIWYSDDLARRGVRAVSAAPGGCATSFFRENMPSVQKGNWAYYPSLLFLRTPKEGSSSLVFASLANEKSFIPGAFYNNSRIRTHAKSWMAVNDRERQEFMDWAKSQLPIKNWK